MSHPRLSGYTTAYQALQRDYPLRECIAALRSFCDEVIVVDGGSTDGTWSLLQLIAARDPGLRVASRPVDFGRPRWALALDGGLKAAARAMCRGEFCWQADLDEIPADDAGAKIHSILPRWPADLAVLAVPFVEYWGSVERARADVPACFPRLSRNLPEITHGVPLEFRRFDADGELYAARHRSDSCNYIHRDSYEALTVASLLPGECESLRRRAQTDDSAGRLARSRYQIAFNEWLERLPVVFHVSWLDVERKLRHYRDHWPRFHASLFDEPADAVTPSLFDKPWTDVSDTKLRACARRIAAEGPRVLHGDSPPVGPTIRVGALPPRGLRAWMARHLGDDDASEAAG